METFSWSYFIPVIDTAKCILAFFHYLTACTEMQIKQPDSDQEI